MTENSLPTKFITLQAFIVQNERKASSPTLEQAMPFLTWRVGYTVKSKKSGGEHWTIQSIDGNTDPDTAIAYGSQIVLVDDTGEENKSLRGATLQQGYAFVSGGGTDDPKRVTYPMTVEVSSLSRFRPRKNGRPGTQLIFKDGVKNIVADTFEWINAQVLEDGTQARRFLPRLASGVLVDE